MRILPATVLICIAACSCKNDSMPEPLPEFGQYYMLTYNVTTDMTEARVNFSYSPAPTHTNTSYLPDGYTIQCNNSPCGRVVDYYASPSGPGMGQPAYYRNELAGRPELNFQFVKANGESFSNQLSQSQLHLINFDTLLSTVSLSDSLIIPFSDGPMMAGETVYVTVFQTSPDFAVAINQTYTVAVGDSAVRLVPSDFTDLQPGPATVYLTRQLSVRALDEYDDAARGNKRYRVQAQAMVTLTN